MSRRILNYVSNFDSDSFKGGWDGINYMLFKELCSLIECNYVGPVNPPSFFIEKAKSKILRNLFSCGDFFYFSDRRLNVISDCITKMKLKGPIFYFGSTPWLKVNHDLLYYVYLDICFRDYINLYSSYNLFNQSDIDRICNLEANFLSNAKHIFWGSSWSKNRAEELYRRKFISSTVISTGGVIEMPSDVTSPYIRFENKKLLFISTNFRAKGGEIALEVVRKLNKLGYDFKLDIIGAKPPFSSKFKKYFTYHGYLNKSKEIELKKIINLFDNAFLLLHPTSMDTMGAVIPEAGYFGLPCIAPNSFGIPDLICNNQTGILLNTPLKVDDFVESVIKCVNSKSFYLALADSAKNFMRYERSWRSISKKILSVINEDLDS